MRSSEGMATRYLGIDPGPTKSNYVVFDGHRVLERGLLVPNHDLEQALCQGEIAFDVAAIEQICCYGMSVGQEVLDTCHWTGRLFLAVNIGARQPVATMVPRLQVKLTLCHSPKAKDGNVRQALIDRWGAVGTKKAPGPLYGVSSHLWAALAVAHWRMTRDWEGTSTGTGSSDSKTKPDRHAGTQKSCPTEPSTFTGQNQSQEGRGRSKKPGSICATTSCRRRSGT